MAAPPDCVIAGAGPTGLSLAMELRRRGKNVRIFDRSSGPRPEGQSRALGVLPATLSVLEPSGVTERLHKEGIRIERVQIYRDNNALMALDIKYGGGRWPYLISIPQGRTERILLSEVEKAGVEVEWNVEAVGVENDGLIPALIVSRDGKEERIEGCFVAGCDGIRSPVRQSLGVSFDGDALETPFSLADVRLGNPPPDGEARVDLHQAGIIVQLPLPGGSHRLISPCSAVEMRPEIAPSIRETGWASDFMIQFRHAEHLQKGRVFLAGDAAHVHSPAGGRGMNSGIGDAAWLAWLISEGRENEYEAMRLPVAKEVLRVTRQATNGITAKPSTLRFVAANILKPLLKLGFVQRQAAKRLLAHDMPHAPWIEHAAW
ncbi:MAG: FAD-dependent oxidoreductase [Rhizobiaceae bacterium]